MGILRKSLHGDCTVRKQTMSLTLLSRRMQKHEQEKSLSRIVSPKRLQRHSMLQICLVQIQEVLAAIRFRDRKLMRLLMPKSERVREGEAAVLGLRQPGGLDLPSVVRKGGRTTQYDASSSSDFLQRLGFPGSETVFSDVNKTHPAQNSVSGFDGHTCPIQPQDHEVPTLSPGVAKDCSYLNDPALKARYEEALKHTVRVNRRDKPDPNETDPAKKGLSEHHGSGVVIDGATVSVMC